MNIRTIAIWVCGLLASAIIGGFVGAFVDMWSSHGEGVWGGLAGMLSFACVRLWRME